MKEESSLATNHCLLELFGEETLVSYELKTNATAGKLLSDKIVLLYFSASTCGRKYSSHRGVSAPFVFALLNWSLMEVIVVLCFPAACKQFSPILEKMCRTLKNYKDCEEFEIVLCCGDHMPVPFENYASKMSWWCLPFNSKIFRRLSLEYKVVGFPSLVIIDSDGTVLKLDAVNDVLGDPTGISFPWRLRSLQDVLTTQYLRPDHTHGHISLLNDKFILIFAAGSWCLPCHQLMPRVSEVYQRLKAQRDDFEVNNVTL
jgi:thiol-disulfide isomerase/thioredoxin